jgi:hypothetical protein
MPEPEPTPTPEPAKADKTEVVLPWWLALLRREGSTVKNAPLSVLLFCVVIGIGIYWFLNSLYTSEIRSKTATIEQLQNLNAAEIRGKNSIIELLQSRIQILNGTVPSLPNASTQVKSEALILSSQMLDFANSYSRGLEPYFQMDYNRRFIFRVDKMRNALDQLGQDSSNLDLFLGYRTTQGTPFMPNGIDSNVVFQVAKEIETLANNLK